MAKNKKKGQGKGTGVKEWAELQGANVTTGISLNDTNKFLTQFPDNPAALSHRADALANIAASQARAAQKYQNNPKIAEQKTAYSAEIEYSKLTQANPLGLELSHVDSFLEKFPNFQRALDTRELLLSDKAFIEAKELASASAPPTTPPLSNVGSQSSASVEQQMAKAIEESTARGALDDFMQTPWTDVPDQQTTTPPVSRAEQQSNIKKDVHANKARSNLVDKKAGLSSNLEKNEGSLKPITYTSLQTGETTSGEVFTSGNTTSVGRPVRSDTTNERKASWDTARELLDGSTRSSIENSGLPWTKFTLSTTPRTKPRAAYKDNQNSVPFKDYPQHGRIIPNTVVHKSKEDGGNAVINEGKELNRAQINEDFSKQAEEFSQNKPSSMFSKTTPEEKARLTRLDELTAAYHGLNTNVTGSKGSVEVERRGNVAHDATFDPEIDNFVGPRTDNKVTQIDSMTRAPFPSQLTGISNLEGSDLSAFKAAYNQDLELNRIGKQAGFVDLTDSGIYLRDPRTQEVMTKRSIDPWAGSNQRSLTHGYGMGWGNMWRASAKDNAKRAMTVVNPLSRGNMSLMGEQLGRVSTRDMLAFKANPTIMNRLGITAAPAFAAGFVGYGMYDNQDIGEIVSNLAIPTLALPGARAGLAIGSAVTPAETAFGILRGTGMAVGATVGFVTGAAVALAATAGISDITSNESSIRKFASKMAKTEFLVPEVNSRQSLTARQMALNKLSKSGLNDRALLLGNEAAALGGYL